MDGIMRYKVLVASDRNEELKMKRLSLKQLLILVFVGLMAMAGTSLGDEPPGEGPATGSENEMGQGDQERARDGSCEDFLGVLEESGGKCGTGEQHKYGQDD
jgi:hypothetical protein